MKTLATGSGKVETIMKKQQRMIECGRCGETRQEFLTQEEMEKLNDAIGPIYRQCGRCERMTGWIGSARPSVATKEPRPGPLQNRPVNGLAAEGQPRNGQKRMATQAERDEVNSMVDDSSQTLFKD
jgi:hypothetical protein